MGVGGPGVKLWASDMSQHNPAIASPVPPGQSVADDTEEIPTFPLFKAQNVDVDQLKTNRPRMKLKIEEKDISTACQEMELAQELSSPELFHKMLCKTLPGHELSMSLPNLSAGLDTDTMNKLNEKHIRSSLSDIYDTPSEIMQAHHLSWKKTLSDLSKKLKMSHLNHDEYPSRCLDDGQLQMQKCDGNLMQEANQELLKQHLRSIQTGVPRDLTINVAKCNNRLSAVLENIPLLYIPHTKQLISVTPHTSGKDPSSLPPTTNQDGCKSNIPADSSVSSSKAQVLIPNTPQTAASVLHTPTNPSASSSHGDTVSSPSGTCAALHNGTSSPGVSSLSKTSFLSSSDLDSSLALSQDSDASSRSEHTIIHQEDFHSQGKMDDFDEECADELTKINLGRDSPRGTLQRTNTMGSLSINDGSSFSSISSISTGTDFSVSAASYSDEYMEMKAVAGDADETGFMEVNLHSRNTFERSRNSSKDSGIDDTQYHGAKPKRRGIAGFFTRNLFSRKPKETPPEDGESQSAPGWKLFGRIPPKEIPQKDPTLISEEFKVKVTHQVVPPCGAVLKKSDVEVSSTTALILEQRPKGLPLKNPEEEERHRVEYEVMVQAAKKREMKEAKLRKKHLAAQLRQEEALAAALRVWNNEILTSWDTMHNSKKARDLWWGGIPPAVRGKVWRLAIGNELNLTPELYEICLNRAKDRLKLIDETGDVEGSQEPTSNKEGSVELIKLDVSRTFPQLCIFQKGGPYHELLQGLLGAYACYRPDVGYVQGMSFIAAVLLLNMEVADAFICFANLLNRPCQIAFFRLDENLMKSYFETYEEFFKENLPKLFAHFNKQGLTPDLYVIEWMFTLYAKSLPLDVASRVWDVFCRDGEEFLFRTALGILRMYEDVLLNMDFILLAQFLTRLPEDISSEQLFRSVETIVMTIDKCRFNQVLAAHREPRES